MKNLRYFLLAVFLASVLLFRPVRCFAFDVVVLPEEPMGGECILVRITGSSLFGYRIMFNDGKYKPYRLKKKTKEIFLPLGIKESGTKELIVKKKFIGISLKKKKISVTVAPRKIESYRLKPGDIKMRSRQPFIKEQQELVLRALKYISKKRLWDKEFVLPLDAPISSPFAIHRKAKTYSYYHKGTDFCADSGTPVKAVNKGKIILSKEGLNIYGNIMVIDHGQGIISCYFHLEELLKKEGEPVEKSEIIATVGDTGWSTNPHLHFGIYIRGRAIDPLWWIDFNNFIVSIEKQSSILKESE